MKDINLHVKTPEPYEVPGNLPILVVTEPRNNMSYLCRSVFQYGFHGVFTGLTSSVIHMHYTYGVDDEMEHMLDEIETKNNKPFGKFVTND